MAVYMVQEENGGYVVGIDAGGTSVRVAVARGGTIAGEARGAAAEDGGAGTLAPLVARALADATVAPALVGGVCAGITKVSRSGVRASWLAELGALFPHLPFDSLHVVPDFVIAFHGAVPAGPGVAVIAGTGSVVYAEDGGGNGVRVGGRGWEFGDEGSGAWLTAEAVRRTLRALDGLEEPSPLTESVSAALGTRDAGELGEAARRQGASDGRGFLVPLLLEYARSGDAEAANLFVGAGGWLAAYVRAAQRRLSLPPDAPITVATVGGLWEAGELLAGPFRTVIARWLPNAVVNPPAAAPVVGAVRLAARGLPTV